MSNEANLLRCARCGQDIYPNNLHGCGNYGMGNKHYSYVHKPSEISTLTQEYEELYKSEKFGGLEARDIFVDEAKDIDITAHTSFEVFNGDVLVHVLGKKSVPPYADVNLSTFTLSQDERGYFDAGEIHSAEKKDEN